MRWVCTDGGRLAAGFKGEARDCVCRSVALATGRPYAKVYDELNRLARTERPRQRKRSSARTGVQKPTLRRYMTQIGWEWVPTMEVGRGCRVHLKYGELPESGPLVVSLSRHVTAVIDGVIHDTHDPSRGGTRCVYGYWKPPRVGTAAGIERLCDLYRPHYLEKMRRFCEANDLPDSAAKWLASDDVSSSSLTLFCHLTGVEPPGFLDRSAHPYDLADFRRCRTLIDSLPDHSQHLTRMEVVSQEWAALVEHWQVICASLDQECPEWREGLSEAPDTAKLLKEALAGE